MSITAMKQALGALEWEDCNDDDGLELAQRKAVTALRDAIEQAEQAQPVAWMYDFLNPDSTDEVIRNWVTQDLSEIDGAQGFNVRPLYTAPQRQWVSLTEEEIADLMAYWSDDARSTYGGAYAANGEYVDIPDIIRDAEARLKEKNT